MKIQDTLYWQSKKIRVTFYRLIDALGMTHNREKGGLLSLFVFGFMIYGLLSIMGF